MIMYNFTDRHQLHRQVERLNTQSSEVGPLTIFEEGKPGNTLDYTT